MRGGGGLVGVGVVGGRWREMKSLTIKHKNRRIRGRQRRDWEERRKGKGAGDVDRERGIQL